MEQNPFACAAEDCILAVPGVPYQFGVVPRGKCRCFPSPGQVAGEHSRVKDGIRWLTLKAKESSPSQAKKESNPGQTPGWRGSQQGDNTMKMTEAKLRQIIREELEGDTEL